MSDGGGVLGEATTSPRHLFLDDSCRPRPVRSSTPSSAHRPDPDHVTRSEDFVETAVACIRDNLLLGDIRAVRGALEPRLRRIDRASKWSSHRVCSPTACCSVGSGPREIASPVRPPPRCCPPSGVIARCPFRQASKAHYEAEYARTSATSMLAERVAPVVALCHTRCIRPSHLKFEDDLIRFRGDGDAARRIQPPDLPPIEVRSDGVAGDELKAVDVVPGRHVRFHAVVFAC